MKIRSIIDIIAHVYLIKIIIGGSFVRLRNVKGSREEIAASEFTINNPEEHKGRWNEVFGNEKPVYIEVGMGKADLLRIWRWLIRIGIL